MTEPMSVTHPPAAAGSPLLRVQDLSVEFPTASRSWLRAVEGVSFDVAPGESVGLVGESGSGKTVTGLAVMGLTGATGGRIGGGSIHFEGRELTALPEREWRKLRGPGMGMIFQQPIRSLNPAFTVGDQVSEPLRRHLGMSRKQARARAVELLDMVQIPRAAERVDDYPHAFSGGMSQRVMIAMAMSCNPRLLIADEPTTALDVTVQKTILELLRELQEQTGVSLLFVSHDLAVVAELCQKVIVMYAGEVAEIGTADDVFFAPRHPYTAGLLAAIPKPGLNDRRLTTIPGTIPAPGAWPLGCRFFDRCAYAQAGRCDAEHPPLSPTGPTDVARCLRADEITLQGVERP